MKETKMKEKKRGVEREREREREMDGDEASGREQENMSGKFCIWLSRKKKEARQGKRMQKHHTTD